MNFPYSPPAVRKPPHKAARLNAFVLAAGLGERLLPITARIPKPLLPVLGRPLLAFTLDRVSALPVERIGINLHHKASAVAAWVEESPYHERVVFFPEDPLLDTGGALKNAEDLLKTGVFLVHNSDILTDLDLHALVDAHSASGNVATLALHDYPVFNKVAVTPNGAVAGVGGLTAAPGESRRLAFTGVAVYDPAFLSYLPEGASSVRDAWLAAMSDGRPVGSVDVTGCRWRDLGTPASYAAAVAEALRAEGEWIYVDPAMPEGDVDLDGYVAIEGRCSFGGGAALRNCVVLPGAHIDSGTRCENCIVGDGFRVDLTEPEMLGLPIENDGLQIGTGGSERRYYRVRHGKKSVVRMVCAPHEPDFERHIEYSRFFARHGVPVPQLLSSDTENMRAEFEDLGDLSLYNWLRYPRPARHIEEVYRQVLDVLVAFHVDATRHLDECPLLKGRPFDFDYFRWETTYFLGRFVQGYCGIHPPALGAIEDEFDRLGRVADGLPKSIIHRDFQSQNVMLKSGVPRVVDYQGARVGPAPYDVASILWDPYNRLDDAMRERLLSHYADAIADRTGAASDIPSFRDRLLVCRLQRHMQALGAYGFLTLVKGKPYFAKHIPEALRLLREDLAESRGAWPAIADAVEACARKAGPNEPAASPTGPATWLRKPLCPK